MTDPHIVGTLPASSLVYRPLPRPSLAEVQSIPENSHVIYISWPNEPPEIVGALWNNPTRDEFTSMYSMTAHEDPSEVRAADVFMFYVPPFEGEDALIRRVMGLADDVDPGMLSDERSDYSSSDVAEIVRAAIRLAQQ